jgi:Zn finger protein HypA/HybF involved in hydrogenase expression
MVTIRIDADSLSEGCYTFEYENTSLQCERCEEESNYHDIERDDEIITGEEIEIDRCPHCGAHGSFKYELEEFDEVHMI